MSLFEVGRICTKIAGRDAGRKCVVVENVDDHFVVVDGDVRRKKINIKHLEPIAKVIELKSKASHEEVKKAFDKLDLPVWETKKKESKERPRKQKKKKEHLAEKKPAKVKKAAKKENKVEENVETEAEEQPTEEIKEEVSATTEE